MSATQTRPATTQPTVSSSTWPKQLFLARQVAAPEGPVDMAMMYIAHHGFRRDLAAFCRAVEVTPLEDRATWQALLKRWDLFSAVLHHHHSGEDELLWPLLIERAKPEERQLLEAMEAEHAEIDPSLRACRMGLAKLAEVPESHVRGALAITMTETREALERHLAHEETETMALLQRVLAPQEWQAIDEKIAKSFSLKDMAMLVPWVAHELPADVLAGLFAQPGTGPLKVVYRLFRGRFTRLDRRAFRYLTPPARQGLPR